MTYQKFYEYSHILLMMVNTALLGNVVSNLIWTRVT